LSVIISYTFSSTKLEIMAKQSLPGSKEGLGRERGGRGMEGRNGTNNVCTDE
jgi:hypothetical protein